MELLSGSRGGPWDNWSAGAPFLWRQAEKSGSLCKGRPSWPHSCSWPPLQKVPLEPAMGVSSWRQGRKCCLLWGKCHTGPWNGQNLGWHLVVILAHHSQLMCLDNKFWSHFSVFASTDFGGRWFWQRSKRKQQLFKHADVHSGTSNYTLKGTVRGLIVQDIEHPNFFIGLYKEIWQKWALSQSHWRILSLIRLSTAVQKNL